MALIKTIQEVKEHVRVNFANGNSSLPNMDRAERKFILPLIGKDLYEEVNNQYQGGAPSDPIKELLKRIQAAIAPLAYYLELPLINTQITDIGLQKSVTAQLQPVFKHDFYKVMATLHDQGMDELEVLLEFLEENKGDYPAWISSAAYTEYRRLLVKTGKEFSDIYTLVHPRRCYLLLRPTVATVQEKYLAATVGAEFLAELVNKAAPTEEEKHVIELLKKALVFLTVLQSTGLLAVRLTEAGFTVQSSDAELGDPSRMAADAQSLRWLADNTEKTGNSYLTAASRYLNEKASPTVFATYHASGLYRDPATPQTPLNSQLKSSFSL